MMPAIVVMPFGVPSIWYSWPRYIRPLPMTMALRNVFDITATVVDIRRYWWWQRCRPATELILPVVGGRFLVYHRIVKTVMVWWQWTFGRHLFTLPTMPIVCCCIDDRRAIRLMLLMAAVSTLSFVCGLVLIMVLFMVWLMVMVLVLMQLCLCISTVIVVYARTFWNFNDSQRVMAERLGRRPCRQCQQRQFSVQNAKCRLAY